jgi:ABC-type multidrug transport system fused ATPase/permease subunit
LIAVSGTLRTNLDPFGQYDDAKLWDALRRSYLVDNVKQTSLPAQDEAGDGHASTDRFTLDTIIEDEGANLSVGQVHSPLCISVP